MLVPLSYSAFSAGGIRLSGLNITGDFPPLLASPIQDIFMNEDTANDSLIDLSLYFQDEFPTLLNYSLVNISNSTIAAVRLVNGSLLSVDCTVPAARQWSGVVSIVARATDPSGLFALSNRFNLTVRPVNDPPTITSQPPLDAWVGEPWRYDIAATDPENATLIHSVLNGPAGMVINASSGRLAWTPSQSQTGMQSVSIRVSDGQLGVFQNFTVNVSGSPPGNHPPRIQSEPVAFALAGSEYVYAVIAQDDDFDNLSFSLVASPDNMTIGERTGVIRWTPQLSQKGVHAVIARVSDSKSNGTQAFNITVVANISELAPVVVITEPLPGARVGGKTWLKGTASSVAGANISAVTVSTDGGATWQPASGKTLWMFRLDSSRLKSGDIRILVRATDSANRSTVASVTLNIQNAPSPAKGLLGLDPLVWVLIIVIICAAIGAGAYAYLRRRRRAPPVAASPLTTAPSSTSKADAPPFSPQFPPSPPSQDSALMGAAYPVPRGEPSILPGPQSPPPYPPTAYTTRTYQTMQSQDSALTGAAYPVPRGEPAFPPQSQPPSQYPQAPPQKTKQAAREAPPPPKPVDSAFLIYHDGRLITYFSRSDSIKLDDTLDMIRRFVKASFSGELGRLDAMAYENSNIIMERGNLMYMVVITPLPQYEPLRRQMRALLDDIDKRYRVVFKIWDGDFGKVKGIKAMIESFSGEEGVPEGGAPSGTSYPPQRGEPAPQKLPPASPPPSSQLPPPPSSQFAPPAPPSQPPVPPPPWSVQSQSPQPSSAQSPPVQPSSSLSRSPQHSPAQPPTAWDDSTPMMPTPPPLPPPQPKGQKQSEEK